MSCPVNLEALPSGILEEVFTPENIRGRTSVNSLSPLSFPKSRSALWDNSPTGEKLHIQLCSHRNPRLVLSEKALRLARRHARHSNKPRLLCFFLGSASVDSDEEGVTLTLDRFDPGRDQVGTQGRIPSASLPGDIVVPCVFSTQNDIMPQDAVVQSETELHHCFKSLQQCVSSRNSLDVSQLVKLRVLVYCSQQLDAAVFSLCWSAVCPSVGVEVESVRAIPIIPTALLRNLTSLGRPQQHHAGGRQRGFLTMDQTRKLLLLLESDPKASKLPLVGLWLSGVTYVYNPQVWSWCLRFLFSTALQDRVLSESRSFLLVLFASTHRNPQFFQCRVPVPRAGSPAGSQLDFQLLSASQSITLYQVASMEGQMMQCELGSEVHSRQMNVFREAQCSFTSTQPPAAGLSVSDHDSGVEDEDLSPRPSPSPHLPAQQARLRVQPSVPELSLLIDNSFSSNHNAQHLAGPAPKPPAPTPGNASSSSSASRPPPPPHLHSTPNSNPLQPCICCTQTCSSITSSSSPGLLHPATAPSSHQYTPPPSLNYQNAPPSYIHPSSHHHTPPSGLHHPYTPSHSHTPSHNHPPPPSSLRTAPTSKIHPPPPSSHPSSNLQAAPLSYPNPHPPLPSSSHHQTPPSHRSTPPPANLHPPPSSPHQTPPAPSHQSTSHPPPPAFLHQPASPSKLHFSPPSHHHTPPSANFHTVLPPPSSSYTKTPPAPSQQSSSPPPVSSQPAPPPPSHYHSLASANFHTAPPPGSSSSYVQTPPAPSHQSTSPPASFHQPAPPTPSHYVAPLTHPCGRPPLSWSDSPHPREGADPASPPFLPRPSSCVAGQCCDGHGGGGGGGVVPPDAYQLLLHQDRQLRLLQAQVAMLLESQRKLQSPASTVSVAVGTGASLFWGDSVPPLANQEVQTPPAGPSSSSSSPKPPPSSPKPPPSSQQLSTSRPLSKSEGDDTTAGQVTPCSPPDPHGVSGLQSPVLGESASMYTAPERQQSFYRNLMTQLSSRLQESQGEEVQDSRRKSLSEASNHSHSSSSSSSSSSATTRKKQQRQSPAEDPVISATLRHLQQLGVDTEQNDLLADESHREQVRKVERASTLATINPAAVLSSLGVSDPSLSVLLPERCSPAAFPLLSGHSADLSLEANAIALRYLSDSQLSRLPAGGAVPSSHSVLSPSNMSVATRTYMRRYCLIPEEEEEEKEEEVKDQEAPPRRPLSDALNTKLLPQSQLIRDLRPKMKLLTTGNKENRASPEPEGSVGNILDLSRLRQLPKLF